MGYRIPASDMKKYFRYNPFTGEILRVASPRRAAFEPRPATRATMYGSTVTVSDQVYRSCDVAWCLFHGSWPQGRVRYRDKPGDDQIDNLYMDD